MQTSKEITKKRCILCEEKKGINDFSLSRGHSGNYCDDCWNNKGNDYLYNYEHNFNYDLFYLKYPEERPSNSERVNITSSLTTLERRLSQKKELLPRYQRKGNEKNIQRISDDIARLEREISELKKYQAYQEQK